MGVKNSAPEIVNCPGVSRPSPEYELIVSAALLHPGRNVLDLGAGTGCIAVALAMAGKSCTAADISPASLACTAVNAQNNAVSIRCIQSNFFEDIDGRFDIITCSPPLGSATPWLTPSLEALKSRLPRSWSFLDTGSVRLLRKQRDRWFGRFLAGAKAHLEPQGCLLVSMHALELPDMRRRYPLEVVGELRCWRVVRIDAQYL